MHGRELRNADDLYIPLTRLDIRRFSIRLHGPHIWNSYSPLIRNSESVNIFKRRLRSFIIDSKLEI